MDELYAQFERMIHGLVLNTSSKYPHICREELLCEGNYLFLQAVETYDDSQSTLSTWVTVKVGGGLRNYATLRDFHQKKCGEELPELPAKAEAYRQDLLNRFGDDARMVVNMVLTAPEEFTKGMVREILKDMGWVERRICECFRVIRTEI